MCATTAHFRFFKQKFASRHPNLHTKNCYHKIKSIPGPTSGSSHHRVVCRDSFTMLKYRPTDRSHTCRPPNAFPDWTHETVQESTKSNEYRAGTGPGERGRASRETRGRISVMSEIVPPVQPVVVSGQLHDAQIPARRPPPHVQHAKCILQLDRTRLSQEGHRE